MKGGGGRKKKEEEKEVWKWWEETPHPEGVKWLTLGHKVCGPPTATAVRHDTILTQADTMVWNCGTG